MEVLSEPGETRAVCDGARTRRKRVALVPTMGALHRGHAALIDAARARADFVVLSIFVNPTQFGPQEDFARYPRPLEDDLAMARAHGVDVAFTPDRASMYPAGEETRVRPGPTAAALCGEHRPEHFEGVATVVTKLFAIAGPCVALFGRKDYQQLRVIARLALDLLLPVEVVGLPTVREPDGLALSSRNRYLAPPERARALGIPDGLGQAARAFAAGERRAGALRSLASRPVTAQFDVVDYVTMADADTVVPYPDEAVVPERALLAVAARLGTTRLIDNVVLGEDPAPR